MADTSSTTAVLPDQSLIITVREKSLPGHALHPTLASDVRLGLIVSILILTLVNPVNPVPRNTAF